MAKRAATDPTRISVQKNPIHVTILMLLLIKNFGLIPNKSKGAFQGSLFFSIFVLCVALTFVFSLEDSVTDVFIELILVACSFVMRCLVENSSTSSGVYLLWLVFSTSLDSGPGCSVLILTIYISS